MEKNKSERFLTTKYEILKIYCLVTFKIKHRNEWFLAVQQNGIDLESNLDVYILQDYMQFYEDLARIVLKNHGCSGNMKNEPDCVKCADCDRMLVVMEM